MRASRTTMLTFLPLIALLTLLGTGSRTLWAGPQVWTSIGPDGGDIYALAIDPQSPTTIYAGTDGGISKSTDGGARWKALSVSSFELPVSTLAIDPLNRGTVYAGTYRGVFKTTDGGESWSGPQITLLVM